MYTTVRSYNAVVYLIAGHKCPFNSYGTTCSCFETELFTVKPRNTTVHVLLL